MEFLALSDTVLRALAMEDRELRRVCQGVFPANQLPPTPLVQLTLSIGTLQGNPDSIV